ncbi:hypothetical protein [Enterococcus avium]|uniref:hypothetical protein n=1 Tax=Enterococcus avium TaxID=33945 RepID=UPI001F5A82E9|nr:hypothetical protein [Enterococcus avium]
MRFQWLKDYQDLEEQLLYLKWNLNKSKLELQRWTTGDLSKIRIEKNSRSSLLEETIEKTYQEIEVLEEQRKEMLAIIQSFKGIENEIVRLKYIEGLKLEEIVEETGYSDSYVRKKHAEIRSKLQFIDDYEARNLDRQAKKEELEYYDNKKRKNQQLSLF